MASSAAEWYLQWLSAVLGTEHGKRVPPTPPSVPVQARRGSRSRSRELRRTEEYKVIQVLQGAVSRGDLELAQQAVDDLVKLKARPPPSTLITLLGDVIKKPGAEAFAQALRCCSSGGLQIEPMIFARLLGQLMSREAPHAQVRAMLNTALPRDAPIIPLVPEDLSPEERVAAFEDGKKALDSVPQEDGELADTSETTDGVRKRRTSQVEELPAADDATPAQDSDEEKQSKREAPEVLIFRGHEELPELNGDFVRTDAMPEVLDHDRPIYVKAGALQPTESSADAEQAEAEDVYAYYWQDDESRPWRTGWYLGTEVAGEEVLAYNPSDSHIPPRQGWQSISDGVRKADRGEFVTVEEVISTTAEERREKAEEVEQALSELKLDSLQGMVVGRRKASDEYFCHFVTLLHLERLAELGTYRRRMLRHPIERLVRIGWALDGLWMQSSFGRKEGRAGMLPGHTESGSEFVVFSMPRDADLDRLRFRVGESVLLSRGDPLHDKVGEGSVVDMDEWKLVVHLFGKMPDDAKSQRWRLDAYANRTVYQRQMRALVRLVLADKLDPLCELLVRCGVGRLDDWVARGLKDRAVRGSKTETKRPWRHKKAKLDEESASADTVIASGEVEDEAAAADRAAAADACASAACEDVGGLDAERVREAKDQLLVDPQLNDSQRESIEKGLLQRCTIIQGPPGTGKTHVSVRLLQLLTHTLGLSPVLATSDSNVAVDNIAEGLNRLGVKAVRMGRPEKVREHLEEICVDTMIAKKRKELKRELHAKLVERAEAAALAAESAAAQASALKAAEMEHSRLGRESSGADDPELLAEGLTDDEADALDSNAFAMEVDSDDEGNTVPMKHAPALPSGVSAAEAEAEAEKLASLAKAAALEASGVLDGDDDTKLEARTKHEKRLRQRQEEHRMRMAILQDAEVVCCTTISSGGDMLKDIKFKAILIDEVAQATETSTIVPIVLRGARQLILVGDHCQLPPAVLSREAELRGLSLSIYSRLTSAGVPSAFLDTQYRSHPQLAEFSARTFYNGNLLSGTAASKRPPPKGFEWPNPEVPVAFVEVGSREELEGESKMNPGEVRRLTALLQQVLGAGELGHGDIGVVTPYMAQVRALRRALRRDLPGSPEELRALEIASVDNFQGREKELIVFSAVRSNKRGNVGFLADWRRLNVMLTRAKRGLVVLGTARTLRHDCHWQQWLEWCQEHDAIAQLEARDQRDKARVSAKEARWSLRGRTWRSSSLRGARSSRDGNSIAARLAERLHAQSRKSLRRKRPEPPLGPPPATAYAPEDEEEQNPSQRPAARKGSALARAAAKAEARRTKKVAKAGTSQLLPAGARVPRRSVGVAREATADDGSDDSVDAASGNESTTRKVAAPAKSFRPLLPRAKAGWQSNVAAAPALRAAAALRAPWRSSVVDGAVSSKKQAGGSKRTWRSS
eukprot:TRINITY_DN21647_c0_g1_i1.p1 TRINITY_DN21647_c0_g1~~TRINITY_DN21647_c0_g1_i1.p1  ORF type:complete len:1434 (-),score=328.59 TRINITY_DN21647_c0_g1_i1:95-4396(-)